jgi:hypothetical protein
MATLRIGRLDLTSYSPKDWNWGRWDGEIHSTAWDDTGYQWRIFTPLLAIGWHRDGFSC